MDNITYLKKYKFKYIKNIIFNDRKINNKKIEYFSDVYLKNLEENTGDIENKYNLFYLKENNINIFIDEEKIRFPEYFIHEVFSSLVIYLSKNSFYCKIIDREELIYRLEIIERACKNRLELLKKIDEIRRVIYDENLLFYNVNENKLIKCLFGNPYFRNVRLFDKERIFYIYDLIENTELPIKIEEKSYGKNILLKGAIDYKKINNSIILRRLGEIYNIKVENYIFDYKLKMNIEEYTVKNVCIEMELKINNDIKIREICEIIGEQL